MDQFQWNDLFSVGNTAIDQQHKKLFSIINDLIAAQENRQEQKVIEKILSEILSYTEYHFSFEEELFTSHPDAKKHCLIHEKFVEKAMDLKDQYISGVGDITEDTLEFLVNWLKNHVLHTDVVYFRELGHLGHGETEDLVKVLTEKTNRFKVLVVDDSDDQRMLLRMILQKEGYEVLEAADGNEALELCEKHSDLRFIITDLRMPGMDGYELIRVLRQNQIHYMYIIVVTGIDEKKTVLEALSAGANDFLTKPVLPEELGLRLHGGQQLMRLEIQDELIFSMAKLADYRSEETGLHLDRVREYTFILGRYLAKHFPEMGVTTPLASEISKVSPLHDIGKVGIVDRILQKPGRLTKEEFTIMKEHTRIGGDLLSDIYTKTASPAMRLAFEIAMYHHERWDGQGYPGGLSGNGIPVAARITALADVYDALTTKRVYKEAFDHEKSKTIILEGKGVHFDHRIVDAFLALQDEFIELKETLKDK